MSPSFQTWKLLSSAGLIAGSYFSTMYLERKNAMQKSTLNKLDEQIQKLYGPLYGHCLVLKSSYLSVMGNLPGMTAYLKEAEVKKDARAIRRWRSFVWNNIRPLEKEIHDLFIENAHLVERHDGRYPTQFVAFISNSARFEFIIERWKNEKGVLELTSQFSDDDYMEENNAPTELNYSELFEHVSSKYELLQDQRDSILRSMSGASPPKNDIKQLINIIK